MVAIDHIVVVQDVPDAPERPFLYAFPRSDYTRFGHPLLTIRTKTRCYLRLSLPDLPHEVYCCAFLDAQNRVIAFEELFRGTLTQTSVYPREVVKRALHHNCGAFILAHNHPSGVCLG